MNNGDLVHGRPGEGDHDLSLEETFWEDMLLNLGSYKSSSFFYKVCFVFQQPSLQTSSPSIVIQKSAQQVLHKFFI